MIDSSKKFLTIKEAATYLSLCYESVRRIIAAGRINVHRPLPGKTLISTAELDSYMRSSVNSRGRRKRRPNTESSAQ